MSILSGGASMRKVTLVAGALIFWAFGTWAQDVDPKAEMVRFVGAIAKHARDSAPGFGVLPQNASELGAEAGYLSCVTGIGQEETYCGYKKDGKATPAEVTAQIESRLDVFRAAGKIVLTVDYPFKDPDVPVFNKKAHKKTDSVYSKASAKGYIPYCTVRNLDYLVVSPGHEPAANDPPVSDWGAVKDFLYQLQPQEGQERGTFLAALGSSKFDLILMDYSYDGSAEAEFTRDEIAQLKGALGGKLLAYLSIGEAEEYRWYWDPAWDADHDGAPDPGAPAWLDRENPDWPGNYKVRYWDAGWQAIVLKYVDRILAQGFDGVYLDLVDAYEYYQPVLGPSPGAPEPRSP
jgi:cysteinyl-tRNA synthetase, unknown class